jgi:dCTP diphosphatase
MLSPDILKLALQFRRDREWEQFHTPQNLAIAISVEAGELLEHFQWMQPGEDAPNASKQQGIANEIADLAILLSYLANDLCINMDDAVRQKLADNAARYPVQKSRGNAKKYTEL